MSHLPIYFWLVLINFLPVIMSYLLRGVAKTPTSKSLQFFLMNYVFFCNPLLIVQLLEPDDWLMRVCSTLIFAAGILFIASLGYFMIVLSASPEIRSWRFALFQVNHFFILCSAIGGHIEQGAEYGEVGLRPIPGPLMTYFNISVLIYGIYFITVFTRAYRATQDPLLLSQMRAVLFSGIPAILMFVITNAVIPPLTNDYQATPAGALWFLLLFSGVAYVFANGRALSLSNPLRNLGALPVMHEPSNIGAVVTLFKKSIIQKRAYSPPIDGTDSSSRKLLDASPPTLTKDK